MLKDKNKNELIEIIYKLEIQKESLLESNEYQSELIYKISKEIKPKINLFKSIISFFTLPFKLKRLFGQSKEYFFNLKIEQMASFEEKQLLEAIGVINAFENKDLAPKEYKDYFFKLLDLKGICDNCGDIMSRLHDDFQKRINLELQTNYPELLKGIKFVSGKYNKGGYWETRVPVLCYSALEKMLKDMKKDIEAFRKRGYKEQSGLIAKDFKTLQSYISEKKAGNFDTITDTGKEKIDKDFEDEKETEEKEETEESTKPVETVEPVEEKPAETVEKYDNVAASKMKKEGMTLKEIAEFFGLTVGSLSGRLKRYEDKLQAEKETEEKEETEEK